MATVRDASGVLAKLLNGGHSTIAGRLAPPRNLALCESDTAVVAEDA